MLGLFKGYIILHNYREVSVEGNYYIMQPDDSNQPYTFNQLTNEDKELLLANGHKPGELQPEDEQELLKDLREDVDGNDEDSERNATIADEHDGT